MREPSHKTLRITIAQNLAYGTYSAVFVPTEEDLAVRDYIRMRNDHKAAVKRIKQQINSLCMRHGYIYQRTKWTAEHLKYIQGMTLSPLYREILQEYLATMEQGLKNCHRRKDTKTMSES